MKIALLQQLDPNQSIFLKSDSECWHLDFTDVSE